MGEVDVLDMLFDSSTGILGVQSCDTSSSKQQSTTSMDLNDMLFCPDNLKTHGHTADFDSDWSSSFLASSLDGLDHNEFFNALLETNLPDDLKQQQQQLPAQKFTDHAYSITPSSPHSDSGISNGPYSPSSSSSNADELPQLDIERELFAPLDLKSYEDEEANIASLDPMLLDSISECSSSPGLLGNESPINFDFEDLTAHGHSKSVEGLTISTDESTKVIKVLSVNGSRSTSLLTSLASNQKSNSPYPELTLSDEEKDLLRKEGISLPSHLPLTREEEKILRSVRRRIRNKASARNSRRKKQDYMEALEKRVKLCTDEKRNLQKKVNDLEKQNSSLIGQLKKLQRLVTDSTRQTAKTGTCAMILALSFALVLLPNYQSLIGGSDSTQDTLMKAPSSDSCGRPSRSLLSKPEDYITSVPQQEKSFNYVPFLNFNKMASLVTPARELIAEPVEGDKDYVHDPIDDDIVVQSVISPSVGLDEKVIHMEITKLPDNTVSAAEKKLINETKESYIINKGDAVRLRTVRMDVDDDDEL